VLDIVDARCNHEVQINLAFLQTHFTFEILNQAKKLWRLFLEQCQFLLFAQFTEVCLYHLFLLHIPVLLGGFLVRGKYSTLTLLYPTRSQALNDQEHGNNDTRVWSSSNACYITSDRLKKKKKRTYNVENTSKLAMQKKGLRKEHVNVGYDSLTTEITCNTAWEWLLQQNTLLNISSKKSPSSSCSTSLFWMTLASSSSRSAASTSFSLKPAWNRI